MLKCAAQRCVYLKSCLLTLDKRWGKTQGHLGGGGNCREVAVADNTISGFPVPSIHIQRLIGLVTELILGSRLRSEHRLFQKGKLMTIKLNILWEFRTDRDIYLFNKLEPSCTNITLVRKTFKKYRSLQSLPKH